MNPNIIKTLAVHARVFYFFILYFSTPGSWFTTPGKNNCNKYNYFHQ